MFYGYGRLILYRVKYSLETCLVSVWIDINGAGLDTVGEECYVNLIILFLFNPISSTGKAKRNVEHSYSWFG